MFKTLLNLFRSTDKNSLEALKQHAEQGDAEAIYQLGRVYALGKGEEKSGGRERATILGDLWEAFLGALYLDQGLPAVEKFLNQVMIPQVEKGNFDRVTDYKTALQERLQVNGTVDITYTVIDESGPAHAKEFTMQVAVDGKELSTGLGKSKKLAEQAAAKAALEQLGN